jgi:cation diffusion facilitator family transporter
MDQSEKIGFYSIGVNLILVGIKVGLSFLSGSVALFADAIHSATDVISSATVVAGIKISKRTSKNFPYGLYKVENFVSLLSSVFIFLAGYEIVHTVFFKTPRLNMEKLPYAMGGVLLTVGITFAFSRYELAHGKQIGSPSLIAYPHRYVVVRGHFGGSVRLRFRMGLGQIRRADRCGPDCKGRHRHSGGRPSRTAGCIHRF